MWHLGEEANNFSSISLSLENTFCCFFPTLVWKLNLNIISLNGYLLEVAKLLCLQTAILEMGIGLDL